MTQDRSPRDNYCEIGLAAWSVREQREADAIRERTNLLERSVQQTAIQAELAARSMDALIELAKLDFPYAQPVEIVRFLGRVGSLLARTSSEDSLWVNYRKAGVFVTHPHRDTKYKPRRMEVLESTLGYPLRYTGACKRFTYHNYLLVDGRVGSELRSEHIRYPSEALRFQNRGCVGILNDDLKDVNEAYLEESSIAGLEGIVTSLRTPNMPGSVTTPG